MRFFLIVLISSLIFSSSAFAGDDEAQCRVLSEVIEHASYKGKCLNGLAHGYGVATDKKIPFTYKGHFKNGRFNGSGTLVASMNEGVKTWDGSWLNGKVTGYATFDSKKFSYKGQWSNGVRHGQGSQIYHEESKTFTGTFSKGNWVKGRLTLSDGSYTQGQWSNGELNGYIIESVAKRGGVKGQYRNGLRNGKGIFIPKGGKPISVVWKNGKLIEDNVKKPQIRSNFKGSERAKCFDVAWTHLDNGGLGLTRGSAIELCKGAGNVKEVTQCFRQAWTHTENGGLGLTRGSALELCKGVDNSKEVTQCFRQAWAHTENGGLGLTRGGAVELCKGGS